MITNGQAIYEGTTYQYKVTYECHNGYKVNGPVIRTCEGNGRWSGSVPRCIGECPYVCSKIWI